MPVCQNRHAWRILASCGEARRFIGAYEARLMRGLPPSNRQRQANQKFVADFRSAYKRDPSFYAAQAYDAANFINSAVVAVKGDLTNKDGIRAAMEKADYASVRGPYHYGNNHFPIQDRKSTRLNS